MRAIIFQSDKETQTKILRYIKWKPETPTLSAILKPKLLRNSIRKELEYRRECYYSGYKPFAEAHSSAQAFSDHQNLSGTTLTGLLEKETDSGSTWSSRSSSWSQHKEQLRLNQPMSDPRPIKTAHIVSKNSISTEEFIKSLFWWTTTDYLQAENYETGHDLPSSGFTTRCYRWQIVDFTSADLAIYLIPSSQGSMHPGLLNEIKSIVLQKPVVVLVDDLYMANEQIRRQDGAWFVPVSFKTGEGLLDEVVKTSISSLSMTATAAFDEAVSITRKVGG